MTTTSLDVFGFARDAEENSSRRNRLDRYTPFCLNLLIALSDQLAAEGHTGEESIPELQRRKRAVFAGLCKCPIWDTCQQRPQDLAGKKLVWQQQQLKKQLQARQMSFL